MAEAKTEPTTMTAEAFLSGVEPAIRREDARVLDALFRKVTGEAPVMWGPSIIGYGAFRTTYDSGRAVHSLRVGFSPRKAKHSLYLAAGCEATTHDPRRLAALERLGKHTVGAACIYVTRLADIDISVLEELIAASWQASHRAYPES